MKHFCKRYRKQLCFLAAALSFAVLCSVSVLASADSYNATVISELQQFDMPRCNLITYPFRELGWLLIVGLTWIANGLESVVYGINQVVGGFFTAPEVQAVVNKVLPLAGLLLIAVIAFIGFQFMMKKQDANVLLANFLVGLLVLVGLPYAITQMYAFTTASIDYLGVNSLSIGSEIVSNGVTDCLLYDNLFGTGQSPQSLEPTNHLSQDTIMTIDPTELIDTGAIKNVSHPEYYENYLTTDSDGNLMLTETKDGLFGIDFLSNQYYRWKIDWFGIIATLIITVLALVLAGIKIARLLFELVVHQLMAQAFAITDIYGGQRLKRCLQGIVSTFVTLFGCFLLLQLYTIGSAYISANANNIFEKIIMLTALAFAVVDGPNIFESVIGIDAGLNRMTSSILGTRLIMGGIHSVKNGVSTVTSTVGKTIEKGAVAAGVAGGIAGGKIAGNQDVKNGADLSSALSGYENAPGNGNGYSGRFVSQQTSSSSNADNGNADASIPLGQVQATTPRTEGVGVYTQSGQTRSQTAQTATQGQETGIDDSGVYAQSGQTRSQTAQAATQGQETGMDDPGVYAQTGQTKKRQNRKTQSVENQTLGGYVKQNLSQKVATNPVVSATRRSYTLSKNSQILKKNKAAEKRNLNKNGE